MLQVKDLAKAYGGQSLFEDVTWHVSTGDRVGLTGPNGAGKTTLFRILAGLERADRGEVTVPRGTTVGFLPQEGLTHQGRSLHQEAMSVFAEVLALQDEQRQLEEAMGRLDPESAESRAVLKRYGECQELWDRKGGFSLEARVDQVLRGLGFTSEDFSLPTETFSGGWQMRIALAKLLLSQPSLLLLDEPTNHLDLEARNWLEDYLAAYPHAVVLVSHDRYFLDRVVTRITVIDRRRLVDYPGNYSGFLAAHAREMEELRARAAHQEEERERIQRFIDRFRYKATKAAQVQSRVKMLEKMQPIEVPPERKPMTLRLPAPPRSGRIVVELKKAGKRYGAKEVFRELDLLVERGEKVALVGPNGAGKSTLTRLLGGVEAVDCGERRYGANVTVAYFGQDRSQDLDEEKTVLGELMDVAPLAMVPKLRTILGAFLFRGDDVDKKVKVLSGGEKSRLALAKMLLRPTNLLVMDEPTNHLDLDSKEVLLEALQAFSGTVVIVSHDRHFIDELATRTAAVGGGTVRMYWGNYEDYLRAKESEDLRESAAPEPAAKDKPSSSPARREGGRPGRRPAVKRKDERKEIERLEQAIADMETAVASLEGRMAVPGFYDDRKGAEQVVVTHQSLKAELDKLYREWETLAARQSQEA
jgi:ATP-binding cassette subfamily F protein 3